MVIGLWLFNQIALEGQPLIFLWVALGVSRTRAHTALERNSKHATAALNGANVNERGF